MVGIYILKPISVFFQDLFTFCDSACWRWDLPFSLLVVWVWKGGMTFLFYAVLSSSFLNRNGWRKTPVPTAHHSYISSCLCPILVQLKMQGTVAHPFRPSPCALTGMDGGWGLNSPVGPGLQRVDTTSTRPSDVTALEQWDPFGLPSRLQR